MSILEELEKYIVENIDNLQEIKPKILLPHEDEYKVFEEKYKLTNRDPIIVYENWVAYLPSTQLEGHKKFDANDIKVWKQGDDILYLAYNESIGLYYVLYHYSEPFKIVEEMGYHIDSEDSIKEFTTKFQMWKEEFKDLYGIYDPKDVAEMILTVIGA